MTKQMKQNRNKNQSMGAIIRIRGLVLILATLLLASACSREEDGMEIPTLPAEKNVTLEVSIPGIKTPSTYGMTTTQENTVGQLTILAYKSVSGTEVLDKKITATAADITSDAVGNVKVKLTIPEGQYHRLVLVANADSQLAGLATGAPLSALNALEYTHATGRWNTATPDYLPMSGEHLAGSLNGIAIKQGASNVFSGIKLYRMLAGVDVRNTATGFTLNEVSLYNMKRNGRIVKNANYSATPAQPNLPGTLQPATSPIIYPVSGTTLNNEIYVFEAAAPNAAALPTSPRIVVKGTYQGTDYYYPVDFTYDGSKSGTTKGAFMPVVRNHRYVFTITKVTGTGFTAAADALASTAVFTNIDVQVLTIDDDFTDVYYNGQNFLAINTTGAEIMLANVNYSTAQEVNTVTVLTDAANFTIECYNADDSPAGAWLQPSAGSYAGGSKVDAFLKSPDILANMGLEKQGYIIVKAAGLESEKIPVEKLICGKNGTALKQLIGTHEYLTHRYLTGTSGEMQCWMVENSMEGTGMSKGYGLDWNGNPSGTINNSESNRGNLNGYYYAGYQARQANNACPTGWHLPTHAEWDYLTARISSFLSTDSRWWGCKPGTSNKDNAFAGYCSRLQTPPGWIHWNNQGYWWCDGLTATVDEFKRSDRMLGLLACEFTGYYNVLSLSVRCVQD